MKSATEPQAKSAALHRLYGRAKHQSIWDRTCCWLFWAGLVGVALLLLSLQHVPFQDFPNRAFVLDLDRHIANGMTSPFFQRGPGVFGYSMHIGLSRLTAPMLSPDQTLRLMCVLSALMLPLSVAYFAKVLGIKWHWAGLTALPLALSWPLKLGLTPYTLGLGFTFFAAAAAARLCQRVRPRRVLVLSILLLATYLSHALAFALTALIVTVLIASHGVLKRQLLVGLGVSFIPPFGCLLFDLAQGAFSPVAGTELMRRPQQISFRPLGDAAAHLFTRSYGIANFTELVYYLPLIGFLLFGLGYALYRRHRLPRGLGFVTLIIAIAAIACPETTSQSFYVGSRTAVAVVALASVLISVVADLKPRLKPSLIAAVLLALSANTTQVATHAQTVALILGDEEIEKVHGRWLTASASNCHRSNPTWGGIQSERHLWARVLAPDAATPYVFSANRFHAIQPRDFRRQLLAPHETVNDDQLVASSCLASNLFRLARAAWWSGYPGVIVTGVPERLGELLQDPEVQTHFMRMLAPGIALIATPPPRENRIFHAALFDSEPFLREGWGPVTWLPEPAHWSVGAESRVEIETAPSAYEQTLTFRAYTKSRPILMEIDVNGSTVATVELTDKVRTYRIPVGKLEAGPNQFNFRYAQGLSLAIANRTHVTSAAFQAFELAPSHRSAWPREEPNHGARRSDRTQQTVSDGSRPGQTQGSPYLHSMPLPYPKALPLCLPAPTPTTSHKRHYVNSRLVP